MNENAKKWVVALRSGQYKQGRGALRKNDSFCCLGVACDLYNKNGWKPVPIIVDDLAIPVPEIYKEAYATAKSETTYSYDLRRNESTDLNESTLPPDVQRWLGLKTDQGDFLDSSQKWSDLTGENDGLPGKSFSEIADLIESEPVGLFVE